MPANGRDHQVLAEGKCFSSSKSQWPQSCNHHKPTLLELASTTFSDYVRKVVLKVACDETNAIIDSPPQSSTNGDSGYRLPASKDLIDRPPLALRNGMAKVTLPEGFMGNGGVDPTGRGPQWQEGTHLGDMVISSPIKQVLRGIGGIYEYTFLDMEPMTVSQFRSRADEYLKSQVGKAEEMSVDLIQRKFWKRLGPTMQPALYGADMEGTLFKKTDYCCGWNVSQLHSCLELLLTDQPDDHKGGIPGVTTPYLYFGMWASVFCAHTEDMDLLSINYLHAGAPKVWYAVAAGEDARRLEQFCEGHYHHAKNGCPEYMRHKRALISPAILKKAGIPFTTTVQYPGDAMITFPGSYHFGFNTGFNVAEATNFAVPEWVPYGRLANVCLCRPDSVRIEMAKFERLLLQYEKEVKQTKRITWRDWAMKLRKKRNEDLDEAPQLASSKDDSKSQATRKPFWVEVMQPSISKKSRMRNTTRSKKRKKEPEEIWHLAKPGGRKALRPSTRVLCIVPAIVDKGPLETDISSNEDEEEEQCFTGTILELKDDYVRVRFDGMTKKDDSWMPIDSPKLFLDGGRWGEDVQEDLPKLHYWKIEESKSRCV